MASGLVLLELMSAHKLVAVYHHVSPVAKSKNGSNGVQREWIYVHLLRIEIIYIGPFIVQVRKLNTNFTKSHWKIHCRTTPSLSISISCNVYNMNLNNNKHHHGSHRCIVACVSHRTQIKKENRNNWKTDETLTFHWTHWISLIDNNNIDVWQL